MSWSGIRVKRVLNKPLVLAFAVLYSLLAVIGSTFSWITTSYSRVNKFEGETRFGAVITENFVSDLAWRPGTAVTKELRVTNTEQMSAFVRITLEEILTLYDIDPATGNALDSVKETLSVSAGMTRPGELDYIEVQAGRILENIDSLEANYWTIGQSGGTMYLYYSEALQPGASTEALLTGIELKGATPNALKNAGYTLRVEMEAVQANADALAGWGLSSGDPVYELLAGKAGQ
jgi:alternate signal-mediated exported protein